MTKSVELPESESEDEYVYDDSRYDSATDWEPNEELKAANAAYEKERARYRKRNPKEYADLPEMLIVDRTDTFIASGCEAPPLCELFGPFWRMDELSLMFAPSGVGKSILAAQISECLARGVRQPVFKDRKGPEIRPHKVLYIDFEMDRWQLAQRYALTTPDGAKLEHNYRFSPDFLRAECFWDGRLIEGYRDYTEMLLEDIKVKSNAFEATVLVIDNISFLTRGRSANATIAFQLMESLQTLKKCLGLSILVIAHTPKSIRPGFLTERELQGSGDLTKVADSIFAIGRSRIEPDLRYLKQIKCRSGRIEYGEENVAVYRLAKLDLAARIGLNSADTPPLENFLGFDFITSEPEELHCQMPWLKGTKSKPGPKLDIGLIRRAKSLALTGMSARGIAAKLGVAKTTASRYAKRA
ncbi:MAG TPA: AAA family ATPase [Pyrinomonadaceae bacterium]|nr:AAA family ATPase [Chloracidobacterium sp.]MBP9935876.1 AAA family ATPase [Pyrinomonadaceae bacterium]MBK7802409.1 AAA family ATPase [Chloracidobacterium sp.]MBK9766016.1 AAA family ATPase [Chloracidobacterium sp.]MBL0239951.1 AAA family ATPase [Chloracidobacterium sp.]